MVFRINQDQQANFFDEGSFLTNRKQTMLKRSWSKLFADKIFPKINEKPYKNIYSSNGRPNTPINVLIGTSILKEFFQLSDDEIVESLEFDIRFQIALHTVHLENQPISDKSLSRFRKRCLIYLEKTGIDLIQNTMEELAQEIKLLMDINSNITRMDSMMISSNIKNLSRLELLHTVITNVCKEIADNKVELPEELKHYAEKFDINKVIYHDKETTKEDKIKRLLKDIDLIIQFCEGKYDKTERYKQLERCINEQTIVEQGNRRLRTKADKTMNSTMMQNPSDPEATYRVKAGKQYKGYVANLVEEVGENGSVVMEYQFEQNNYSDSQFFKDYIEKQEKSETQRTIVTDGACGSEENAQLAKEKNIDLVTTTLKGKPSSDIAKQFKQKNGTITECPAGKIPESSTLNTKTNKVEVKMSCGACEDCPNKEKCRATKTKGGIKVRLSQKDLKQAEIEAKRETDRFKQLARVRNGVETLPSNLRNNYNVDKMPRGMNRGKMWFGFKIMTLNVKKLINFFSNNGNYAENPIYSACAA